MKIHTGFLQQVGSRLRRATAGAAVPGGVYAYVLAALMAASSAARADDLDIYTKATAVSTAVPSMAMIFDTSAQMANSLLSSSGTVATTLLHEASYGMKDALRAVMTSAPDNLQMSLTDYGNDGTYDKGRLLQEMVTIGDVASTVPPVVFTGSVDKRVSKSENDAAQTSAGGARLIETSIDIPVKQSNNYAAAISGSWTSSAGSGLGGTCCDGVNDAVVSTAWSTISGSGNGNRYYYFHPGTNTTQTFNLYSATAATINPVLFFVDYWTSPYTILAYNDDRSYTLTCPAGYTEVTSGANAGKCKNGGSVVVKVAVVDKNSTLTVTGLTSRWYMLIVATRDPGQAGSFDLTMTDHSAGNTFWDSFSGSSEPQKTGFRFENLQIPFNANINSAKLVFTRTAGSVVSPLVIPGIDTNTNAVDFSAQDLNSRSVAWSGSVVLDSSAANPELNIKDLVQDQVKRAGWCPGNAMAVMVKDTGLGLLDYMRAVTFEGGSASAARLVISYDPASGDPSACNQKTTTLRVQSMSEDTTQFADGTLDIDKSYMPTGSVDATLADKRGKLWISSGTKVGLRFSLAPIPAGATIQSAYLQLTARGGSQQAMKIYGIRDIQGSAQAFLPDLKYLDSVPRTDEGNHVAWSPAGWADGTVYTSPNIANLVQEQVSHAGWGVEHTLGFIIQGTTAAVTKACAWEYGPGGGFASVNESDFGTCAARLVITYDDGGAPTEQTNRRALVTHMTTLKKSGLQPMGAAFLKTAEYLGGYFNSFPGDGISDQGSTDTVSPVRPTLTSGACSSNTIVFIADNNEGAKYDKTPYANEVKDFITKVAPGSDNSCTVSGSGSNMSGKNCTEALAKALFDDGDDGFLPVGAADKVSVKTFAINFGATAGGAGGGGGTTGGGTMNALASRGGGEFYQSGSSGELVKQLLTILRSVAEQGAAVAAPGVAVNALNRFTHDDQLYFSLFRPSTRVDWTGNLKRYRLYKGEVVGINKDFPPSAVLTGTGGFFDTDAHSWWSNQLDGAVVTTGGAATESATASRRIFTYLGDNADAKATELTDMVTPDNTYIIENARGIPPGRGVLGIERLPAAYFAPGGPLENQVLVDARALQIVEFLRAAPNASRFWGASIHASPLSINFSRTDPAKPIRTVFYGDNRGFLHAIDAGELSSDDVNVNLANTGGKELFAFLPKELLYNAALLEDNTQDVLNTGYIYGMDGTMSTYSRDDDMDGSMDSVLLYIGMRRGGDNYYALDVTKARSDVPASDRTPKLQFVIDGGVGDYAEMGQTWSSFVQSYMLMNGDSSRVGVFSGGYDAARHDISDDPAVTTDGESFQDVDQLGRMVYIVDAETGQLLWRSGDVDAGKFPAIKEMKYSITADPRMIDRNGNGDADGMYVVDLAGQIFRFDFDEASTYDPYGNSTYAPTTDGGTSDPTTLVKNVVLVAKLGATGVGKGGGAADPTVDNRRFYSYPSVAKVQGAVSGQYDTMLALVSGYREEPRDTKTEEMVFMVRDVGGFSPTPKVNPTVTLDDLVDISSMAETNDTSKPGWYISLDPAMSEKGTGSPLIIENNIIFGTFVINASASECVPDIGETRLWAMTSTGLGLFDTNSDGVHERFKDIDLPGMSGTGQLILGAGGETNLLFGVKSIDFEEACPNCLKSRDTPMRSRWYIQDE